MLTNNITITPPIFRGQAILAVDNRDDNNSEKTNDHIATKLTDSDDIDNHIGDKS